MPSRKPRARRRQKRHRMAFLARAQLTLIEFDFGNKRGRCSRVDTTYFWRAKAKILSQLGRIFALY
ncbi:MAG: hypothetical protein IJH32_09520 [Ruminococcus sp.]|nr:hypothetical protein [Ruminococcus sp.]